MKVAFIGLGNMGSALVEQALSKGIQVVGYNRSREKTDAIKHPLFTPAYSVQELVDELPEQKIIWLMMAVGKPIDTVVFGSLQKMLGKDDIIIDGANSFYKDTQARTEKLKKDGIVYLDCGTSGGIEGARNGASLMIGGDKKAFETAEPLFKALAAKDGYAYFGKSGAGHFVKMAHNGIEYGMMQAVAEGLAIIQASEFEADLHKATTVWSNGSIIESNLVKWLAEITSKDRQLKGYEATIGSLGTGKWTAQAAMDLGIPAPVIAAAVNARYESRQESGFGRKVVQSLREYFGGHNTKQRDAR